MAERNARISQEAIRTETGAMSAFGERQQSRTAGAVRHVPRLPACRSCHQRKVKCDNNRPKCAPCMRNGTACILIFPGSEQEPVSRE